MVYKKMMLREIIATSEAGRNLQIEELRKFYFLLNVIGVMISKRIIMLVHTARIRNILIA
jgi:hypothetical protein